MFSISSNVNFLKLLLKWIFTPICLTCWVHWQLFVVSFYHFHDWRLFGDNPIWVQNSFSMFCLIRVTRGSSMFLASAFEEQFVTYKIALSTCSNQWLLMQQLLQSNSRLFYDPLQISHASLQPLAGSDPVNWYASFGSIWFHFSESYTIYRLLWLASFMASCF